MTFLPNSTDLGTRGSVKSPNKYSSSLKILICSIFFRILNSVFVTTYFNPDEYWQSLEVAHKLVFDYGHLTWEWLPPWYLRSWVHPLLFAFFYKILETLNLDSRWAVAFGPRILQGIFAGITDWAWYKATTKIFNLEKIGFLAWICCSINWFLFFCSVRTFSNSMAALFTALSLAYWPHNDEKNQSPLLALCFAFLAVLFRPTACIFFVLPGLRLLYFSKNPFYILICMVLPLTILTLFSMIAIDSYFYNTFTFSFYNFLNFNLMHQASSLYGTHPWHWYFGEANGTIFAPMLIFVAIGLYESQWKQRYWFISCIFVEIILSFTPHKELRFLLPTIGMWLAFAGKGLYQCEIKGKRNLCIIFLLVINAPAAFYFSRIHQSAPLILMDKLNKINTERGIRSIHFLTNCHATPFYSHIHDANVEMRQLDCSPHLVNGKLSREETEHSNFLANPLHFTQLFYERNVMPQFIVIFDIHENVLLKFLNQHNYKLYEKIFHSHLEEPNMLLFEKQHVPT